MPPAKWGQSYHSFHHISCQTGSMQGLVYFLRGLPCGALGEVLGLPFEGQGVTIAFDTCSKFSGFEMTGCMSPEWVGLTKQLAGCWSPRTPLSGIRRNQTWGMVDPCRCPYSWSWARVVSGRWCRACTDLCDIKIRRRVSISPWQVKFRISP